MFRFGRISSLAAHVRDAHGITSESSEHTFTTYDEFLKWKSSEEESCFSNYVKHRGSVLKDSIRYSYFYCNRSGDLKSKGTGARNTKIQKSSKIGATCTAHMKVEESIANGSCKVSYCYTHCGHKKDLAHIRMPKSLKAKISNQLQAGVSVDKIMYEIRDVSLSKGIKREHLVVKLDIKNIARLLNLDNIQKHSNDQTSVSLWVKEAINQDYNPVLVFKPQSQENAVVGNTDDLGKENFLLGIQTEFQRDAMKKFAGSGGVVCVDATHGTNVYDFFLITVMVLDDYGGVPVAWCISDKEDTSALVQFFKHLHERVGDICPTVFMSDDAEQYHTAWCGIFGPPARKLLCIWHVDRAWKKAIHERVKDEGQKVEVYHILRVLLTETDIIDFQVKLSQAMTYFEEVNPSFYDYIQSTYATRSEQWATCYRMHSPVGTNMAVEAFHRVLKIDYLKHKQNRRLDHLLHILFKINRDLIFNFLRKDAVGKRSHKVCEIQKRHSSAANMEEKGCVDIQPHENGTWKVKSETNSDQWYIIEKVASTCTAGCSLLCHACNICV